MVLVCPSVLRTFLYYLLAFASRLEGAGDTIYDIFVGSLVLEKPVKFYDPSLTVLDKFQPKPPEAVISTVFPL